jgi:cytochrome c oxidase assembly factor CtaG
MNEPPRWIPVLFGAVAFLMGILILGAYFGIVPTDGRRFTAPPAIILGIGFGLLVGAAIFWLPRTAPGVVRGGLLLLTLGLLAVVCNWTAFAPEVIYSSSVSIGPVSLSGSDQVGGRIVFGLAALLVDAVIVATIAGWIRSARSGRRPNR